MAEPGIMLGNLGICCLIRPSNSVYGTSEKACIDIYTTNEELKELSKGIIYISQY